MPNGDILRQFPGSRPLDVERAMPIISRQLLLLDAVQATDVGWWMPWSPFHNGSAELTSPTALTATCQVLVSNAANMPANGYTITIGGSVTAGDVITAEFDGPSFLQGKLSASYTVQAGDTTTTIATGLAAAINAAIKVADNTVSQDTALNSQPLLTGSLNVSSSAAVVTVFTNTFLPYFSCKTSLSGGATETATVAQYDDGQGFPLSALSALSAVGSTAFNYPAMWIKGKCSAYTAGKPTLMVVAVGP